jgi:hypothetical protein
MAGSRLLLLALLAVALSSACEVTDLGPPVADQSAAPAPAATQTAAAPTPSPSAGPPAIHVDTRTGSSQEPAGAGAYRYRVEEPQVVSAALRDEGVDATIRGTLQRDQDDFLDAARLAPAGPTPSDLTCTSRTVRVTARLAVLRVDCNEYVVGAARPTMVTQTFNCDLAGDRVLKLQDLFGSGSAYLDVLAGDARAQVHDGQAAAATAPVVDNFKTFLLGRDGLVIVLTNAGTSPAPEVTVPYGDLKRYLASGMPALVAG